MATTERAANPHRAELLKTRRAALPGLAVAGAASVLALATIVISLYRQPSDLMVSLAGLVIAAAGVSRGTFYFYFDNKQAVLAELVRRAVAQGHAAAAPWLAGPATQVC
jgi:hypothetical protein